MSNIIRFFFSIFFSLFVFSSCEPGVCDGTLCDNGNGTCDTVKGTCICLGGWQRDAAGICTVMWTEKFAGTYAAVSDTCVGANAGLSVYSDIITSTSPKTLAFSNFGNKGQAVNATHINSTSIEISDTIPNGMIFTGTGSLLDTVLVINYILNDSINGNGMDTCIASYY